jgi:urocanate hydratase
MVRTLTTLGRRDDARAVGQARRRLPTHEWAPRVLIANSNLVGDWATWPEFRRLEHLGLTMYGQMTAGSWIYIGTQGIVQGTYETFAAVAEKRYAGTLAGTLTLTGGCGGMGGAQPLAVTLNGGVVPHRRRRPGPVASARRAPLPRRGRRRRSTTPIEIALPPRRAPGLVGRRRRQRGRGLPRAAAPRGARSTSSPTRPARTTRCPTAGRHRSRTGRDYAERSPRSSPIAPGSRWPCTSRRWSASWTSRREVFDYGNSIRDEARTGATSRAFDFPGFVPAYIRPLFCEGKGPFRWAALSGDPKDIAVTDAGDPRALPRQRPPAPVDRAAAERVAFQGCRRASAGSATASATRPGLRSTTSWPGE